MIDLPEEDRKTLHSCSFDLVLIFTQLLLQLDLLFLFFFYKTGFLEERSKELKLDLSSAIHIAILRNVQRCIIFIPFRTA